MELRLKDFNTMLDIRLQYLESKGASIFVMDKEQYAKFVNLLTTFQKLQVLKEGHLDEIQIIII